MTWNRFQPQFCYLALKHWPQNERNVVSRELTLPIRFSWELSFDANTPNHFFHEQFRFQHSPGSGEKWKTGSGYLQETTKEIKTHCRATDCPLPGCSRRRLRHPHANAIARNQLGEVSPLCPSTTSESLCLTSVLQGGVSLGLFCYVLLDGLQPQETL